MQLLLSMGLPVKDYRKSEYGKRYDGALIQILDWPTKTVTREIEYIPEDPSRWPAVSHLFKGAALFGDECWVVTNNEIVVYDRNTWNIRKVVSHPTFNDLHAVLPIEGGYYVCNTGLEIVQYFDNEDSLIENFKTTDSPTADRFDLKADYRNVASTKPHEVHPNHLYFRNGELWVNRCHHLDSAMLSNLSISTAKLPAIGHDGIVVDDATYFTTVNGHICAVSNKTNDLILDIDLNEGNDFQLTVGWTRGLRVSNGKAYVGNTALRETKSIEFAKWIKKSAGGTVRMGSAIIEVDLATHKICDIYELTDRPGAAIYSILEC